MPQRSLVKMLVLLGAAGLGAPALQGCVVAAVGVAGAGGGYALTQERSLGDTARDAGVRAAINKTWRDFNFKLADDLDITVYQGRVLLTGDVTTEGWRQEAVKRAWQVDGVKEVYDEIQVGPEEGFMQDVGDGAISNKLRAAMVGDADIKSINYSVTTVKGNVYIIGSARSQDELNRVIDHARNTGNVRRVVSYVRIRVGEPPSAKDANAAPAAPESAAAAPPPVTMTAPPPPAAMAAPNASTTLPTPRQSIEVTPLK